MAARRTRLDENVETDEVPVDDMDVMYTDPRTCYSFDKRPSEMSDSGRCVAQSGNCDSGVGLDSFHSSFCRDFNQLSVTESRVPPSSQTILSSGLSDVCDSGWSEERPDITNVLYSAVGVQCSPSDSDNELFEQDEDGDTQLHMAIIQLAAPVAEHIISKATDHIFLNLMNDLRQTPLHLSVITNQPHITKNLMLCGALLELRDNKGNTALHIACKEGYRDCVEVLTTPYYSEDFHCSYEVPKQEIPQNLGTVNYEGQTALHLAADNYLRPQPKHAYLQIVHHLLRIGANVNASDGKSGRTILHYTAEHGNMELLSVILEQARPTLNLNAKTYAGKTALMLAVGRGFEEMAEQLLEAGAAVPPGGLYFRDSSDDMSEEEDSDSEYDDICIDGQPLNRT